MFLVLGSRVYFGFFRFRKIKKIVIFCGGGRGLKNAFLIFEKYGIFLIFFIFNFYLFLIFSTLRFLNFCTVFVSFLNYLICGFFVFAFPLQDTPLRRPTLSRKTPRHPASETPPPETPPPDRPKFRSFFLSGGLLVEFWWCLKRRDTHMCTFGPLGLSCEPPAAFAKCQEFYN